MPGRWYKLERTVKTITRIAISRHTAFAGTKCCDLLFGQRPTTVLNLRTNDLHLLNRLFCGDLLNLFTAHFLAILHGNLKRHFALTILAGGF